VVVTAQGEVLHSSGRTGKYIELPAGAVDTNILNMAPSGLRLELRAAMHKAVNTARLVTCAKLTVSTNGGSQAVDLHVQPLRFGPSSEPVYMIVFQDAGGIKQEAEAETLSSSEPESASVRELEAELRTTRERLQTTAEELESSSEELKSSNEELQSINEELQSTNEELETSKEELQSINEELQTVNAELDARVEELSRANNDMANLLDSTQIATVFLDRTLAVKSFTPAAKDVFRLVESDAGRPIMHVRALFDSDGLQEDVERVLRTLKTIERPIRVHQENALYVMRVLPYRTTENVIDGVVLTFTDVTQITQAEARIRELTGNLWARVDDLETILDLVPSGVAITENDRTPAVLINRYGARLLGIDQEHKGLQPATLRLRLFENGEELRPEQRPLERAGRGETVSSWQGRLENHRGQNVHVMISATPLFGKGGQVRGAVAAIVDVTEHKRAEEQQQFLLHELQHRVKNILATISSLVARMLVANPPLAEFQESFLGRLRAMARTHDVLSGGAWSGTELRSLIEIGLEPYVVADKQNVVLDGPTIPLAPKAATTLGMVFHELATNAAKYGALLQAGGQVEVTWAVLNARRPARGSCACAGPNEAAPEWSLQEHAASGRSSLQGAYVMSWPGTWYRSSVGRFALHH
jgi:two-component system, chemotaxis family, CheB/CheR fusion protein